MAIRAEEGFTGGTDYQFKWGGYCFYSRPFDGGPHPKAHCIGIKNLSISQSCTPKQKINSQGYYYTIPMKPGPQKITFSLTYVRGQLNQQLHRLVDFWRTKLGQHNGAFFGGLNGVNSTLGDYILSDVKVSGVELLPSGDWATATIDFTFEEFCLLPIGADLTGVSTAIDVGA